MRPKMKKPQLNELAMDGVEALIDIVNRAKPKAHQGIPAEFKLTALRTPIVLTAFDHEDGQGHALGEAVATVDAGFFTNACEKDLYNPLMVSVASANCTKILNATANDYKIEQARRARPAEMRHIRGLWPGAIVDRHWLALINADGRYVSMDRLSVRGRKNDIGAHFGSHLVNANGTIAPFDPEQHSGAMFAMLQFTEEISWTVSLGPADGVKLAFITDPVGVAEAFALRDVPEGKSRRAAIMHWVRQHSRQKRDGSVTEVIRHLRGQTNFVWNGLAVGITPSVSDRKAIELAKASK